MTSLSFQDMLDEAKANNALDVDTSYLDEYRRTGQIPRNEVIEPEPEPERAEPEPEAELAEPEVEGPASQLVDDVEAHQIEIIDRLNTESMEPASVGEGHTQSRRTSRGGAAPAGTGGAAPASPDAATTAAALPEVIDEEYSAVAAEPQWPGAPEALEATLSAEVLAEQRKLSEASISTERKSDQRDAIQADTAKVRGGSGSGTATLPESGFRLPGIDTQPMVRNLPRALLDALRTQLTAAAVRECKVTNRVAEGFSRRLSQVALVTAFLLAKLDVEIETDEATAMAVSLFRSQDPLLGSVAERMRALEGLERDRASRLERLQDQLREMQFTGQVIEQMLAYSVADRTENFLRGIHNIHEAPIAHKDAVFLRDKAREDTGRQVRLEREREGRPIR